MIAGEYKLLIEPIAYFTHNGQYYCMTSTEALSLIHISHERFSVGDEVLGRILSVRRNSLEDLGIKADIKSISANTDRDNLQKCRIQGLSLIHI